MKRNALCFFTAVVLLLSLIPAIPAAAEDLTISTLAELEAFRDSVNSGEDYHGVTVTLTADIDLGGEDNPWTPIGSRKNPFAGTFDGGDHSITGLYIHNDNDYLGLFGYNTGIIQNLGVEGDVSGYSYIGGIAGRNDGSLSLEDDGIISNCFYIGAIDGYAYVGGLVGYNYSADITDCYHLGPVTGGTEVGGVAGTIFFSEITNCDTAGDITGDARGDAVTGATQSVGGVIGYAYTGTITNCQNVSSVTGLHTTGGVVGEADYCTVISCHNAGAVTGGEKVGGVVGSHYHYDVTDSYNTGVVLGGAYTGGVVGFNYAFVNACYNTGTVTGTQCVGGITGKNCRRVHTCYNIGTVNGMESVGGGLGAINDVDAYSCYYPSGAVTTNGVTADVDAGNTTVIDAAAFAEQSTYNDWDFVNIWIMNESLGRPILRAVPEDGSGIVKGWFVDVPQGAWYYEPVQYTFAQGLMTGVSGTEFAPDADVTRGMFVTVLYRMENTPETAAAHGFTDVPADAYYADAVAWASENGIVTGFSAEQFAPEENITREQMAAILHRYAAFKGHDTAAHGALSYTDNGAISDYARDAVTWAADNGILQGNENGTFAPAANATRAEAAAVFQRMAEKLQ